MKTNDKKSSQIANNVDIDNSGSSEVVVLEISLRGEKMKKHTETTLNNKSAKSEE